jgi:hypothetical protein
VLVGAFEQLEVVLAGIATRVFCEPDLTFRVSRPMVAPAMEFGDNAYKIQFKLP